MADVGSLVDLERYPIVDLEVPAGSALVAEHRAALGERGVSGLPGFVRPDAVAAMVAEADRLAPAAFHQDVLGTPYLGRPAVDDWPSGHPRSTWSRSSVHTLGYDQIPLASPLRALYEWDPLLAFVGAVLGWAPAHRYADPMGALNLAVMTEGDVLGWHYDQTDAVVSVALQASIEGGHFENVARLRGPVPDGAADGAVDGAVDERYDERYDDVAAVLAGDPTMAGRVTVEPMTPGTLLLFEGRRSLHRVSPVAGPVARLVGLLGYDAAPGTVSTEALRRTRYGRTTPFVPPQESPPPGPPTQCSALRESSPC